MTLLAMILMCTGCEDPCEASESSANTKHQLASDRPFWGGDVVLMRVTEFLNENLRWTSTT